MQRLVCITSSHHGPGTTVHIGRNGGEYVSLYLAQSNRDVNAAGEDNLVVHIGDEDECLKMAACTQTSAQLVRNLYVAENEHCWLTASVPARWVVWCVCTAAPQ